MERYTRLYTLPENLYTQGSPVIIAAGALLLDNQTGSVMAQLKFCNVSPRTIKAVIVSVDAYDVTHAAVAGVEKYQYLDFHAERDAEFGQKQAILLTDPTARSFKPRCTRVVFADDTVWEAPENAVWESLTKPTPLSTRLSGELTEQYERDTVEYAAYVPESFSGLWRCTCGALNNNTEETCRICCLSRKEQTDALNEETLQEHLTAHKAAEAEKAAKLRAEQEAMEAEKAAKHAEKQRKAKARRKKAGKIAAITAAAACVCFAAFLLVTKVIIPNKNYNDAVALMDAGQYEEAITAFEAMDGYKDSTEQIEACKIGIKNNEYDAAFSLMNEGKYEEAITAFEAMDGYKDSAEQIEACEIAIKDIAYDSAVALMNGGEYEEAIAAFEAMDGYKDSAEQIEACEITIKDIAYDAAIALMNEGQIVEAYESLIALDGYKDSAEQIEACEIAVKDIAYDAAVVLMNEGQTVEAYESLIALDGYKDSAEKADSIFEAYKPAKLYAAEVGDYVYFGSYEQDNDTSNGKEDIEWLVLAKEDNKILVISKYALDCQPYNTARKSVTWETCVLRNWLNSDFISAAFTEDEKALILETTVTADKNPSYRTDPGNDTTDKIFLLSIDEANEYFSSDDERMCAPTAYAKAQGTSTSSKIKVDGEASCRWWLRSPGGNQRDAAYVDDDGGVNRDGDLVYYGYGCVRPAFWINLES